MKRLKMISLETLQTSNLVKMLYFLHEALPFACGLVEVNMKKYTFSQDRQLETLLIRNAYNMKGKKINVIKTINKLLKQSISRQWWWF